MPARRPNRPAPPPPGLSLHERFLADAEEAALLDGVRTLPFEAVVMRDVAAKRRVAHYGWVYGFDAWTLVPGPPLPALLLPLRERAAAIVGLEPTSLEEALVTEYPAGAGIGWHRDAPMFGPTVIGVSLGSAVVMAFRKQLPDAYLVHKQLLPRGAAYVIAGEARTVWQHTISSCPEPRYSVTFRTVPARFKRP